ncbi:MAG: hypothetical protein HY706_07860 [Candidatus Hydrogenedentes bacterium]|nr:hypothetical protein [Candidatus Hydrogenedentota bacterium]
MASLVALGFHAVNAEASPGISDADLNVLRLIMAEQSKSLAKINNVRVEAKSHGLNPWDRDVRLPRPRELFTTHTTILVGKCGWVERHDRFINPRPGAQAETRMRTVWNEQGVLRYPFGTGAGYLWEYRSPETMSKVAAEQILLPSPWMHLTFALGTGRDDGRNEGLKIVLDAVEDGKVKAEVIRDQAAGPQSPYSIKVWRNDSMNKYPVEEFNIEPTMGYFSTGGRDRDPESGFVWKEWSVQLKEIEPGIWFPMKFEEKHFEKGLGGADTRKPDSYHEYEVTRVEVNPEVPDGQFEWTAAGIPPGIEVFRTDADGEFEVMLLVNGELVPKALVGTQPGTAPPGGKGGDSGGR